MSIRNWLRTSLREAAATASRAANVPEPAESQVVLRESSADSRPRVVEHIAKLPPEVLTATHDVAYDWDYAVKRAELRTLYEKSKDLMWNARTDLEWSTDVDPEREIVADAFNPIFGTDVWRRLDKKTEIPKLRRH